MYFLFCVRGSLPGESDKEEMKKNIRQGNIAVFASGSGSNFVAIAKAVKKRMLRVNLCLLICDNPEAPVIGKAARLKIPVLIVARNDFHSREAFEEQIIDALRARKVDLIVLAGFMRILSPAFVRNYSGRIINIHPALLPAFKGAHAIRDAFDYGVKVSGVTVHFVDELTDHGPIIMQKEVAVKESDSLQSLEARIHKAEHRIYPLALKLILNGKSAIKGRKVVFPRRKSF